MCSDVKNYLVSLYQIMSNYRYSCFQSSRAVCLIKSFKYKQDSQEIHTFFMNMATFIILSNIYNAII